MYEIEQIPTNLQREINNEQNRKTASCMQHLKD